VREGLARRIAQLVEPLVRDEVLYVAPVLADDHQVSVEIARPPRPRADLVGVVAPAFDPRRVGEAERASMSYALREATRRP
jgi:hypothetical protein